MKKLKKIKLFNLFTIIIFTTGLLQACKDDDHTVISNDLHILKVSANGTNIEDGAELEKNDLQIEIIFSHVLNTSSLESALSISNAPDFNLSYDETNSFVSLSFENLQFDSNYTITLPAGNYGMNEESLQSDFEFSFTTKAFVPPAVTLSSDALKLLEGESATVTATLNKPTLNDVTVSLLFSGTAEGGGVDYSVTAESLTIPAGSTSASATLTVINDAAIEGEETMKITIGSIDNAVEASKQEVDFILNDEPAALILKGVMALRWSTETSGSSGKAVHLVALKDIEDLSTYGIGVANNGGGTDGLEFSMPAISVSAGEDILISREPAALEVYFGVECYAEFEHVIETDQMAQNGNDAIELYSGAAIIETYGDANVDGTGQSWDYTGSWAYKLGGLWTTGTVDCSSSSTTTLGSTCIYPMCDQPLTLKGVMAILWDGSGVNGGKALHLLANKDIDNLSQYSIGVANNGEGTDGIEYTFPSIAVAEGDHIILAREVNTISTYFGGCFNGFSHVLETDAMNQNGNDAIELFDGNSVVETFGDADDDGTGKSWEYTGSWAYKVASAWTFGGVDCAATSTSTQNSACSYTFCE